MYAFFFFHLRRVDDRKVPFHVLQMALEAAAVAISGCLWGEQSREREPYSVHD